MSKYIGPALPPHLQHLLTASDGTEDENPPPTDADDGVLLLHDTNDGILSDSSADSEPDSDESDNAYGPAIPSSLKSKSSDSNSSAAKLKTKIPSNESDSDEQQCKNLYGPAIPSELKAKTRRPSTDSEPDTNPKNLYGPQIPPNLKPSTQRSSFDYSEKETYGPALPPSLKASTSTPHNDAEMSCNAEKGSGVYGPTLPPSLKASTSAPNNDAEKGSGVYGPALPQTLLNSAAERSSIIGPSLPPGLVLNAEDEESDDDVVGPMPLPEGFESNPAYIQEQMERRAERMKRKLRGEDEEDSGVAKRETWMLELPPDRAGEFGLGPRQFRARAKLDPGDRSVWTDTPEDALRKQNMPEADDSVTVDDMQQHLIAERDRAMQKVTDKHNKKKRKESLVEMHQRKLKKKQKKEEEKRKGEKKERRPFDRDVDLQANRFDEAQKKAVLRKAQLLDDRFSRGASKFL